MMRNELAGAPLKCWEKGVYRINLWGWKSFLAICRIRWIGETSSWMLYLGRKTFILWG